jgi:hypothetical protein
MLDSPIHYYTHGGEEIRVAAGDYTGVQARGGITQVVYISKTLTTRGGYTATNWTTPDPDANLTTLDAQGLGRVIYIPNTLTVTLEGLQIVNGASASGDDGGGVYAREAVVTMTNNLLRDNTTNRLGGGANLYECTAYVADNTFQNNTAPDSGGDLQAMRSKLTLTHNTFLNNTANELGGGIHLVRVRVPMRTSVLDMSQ